MAVVSISRIQIRRGKKGIDGIPQLASGEMGWAVDSQELYIGNGSVSEGAPQVGNTKILTEYDNILSLADAYEYRSEDPTVQTGDTAQSPVRVTIQHRLDRVASVADFGAVPNDTAVQTSAIQRAVDNLFLNIASSPVNRYVLHFAPGKYLIDSSIKLPPYTTLQGAGKDKTIIQQTADAPVFVCVNGSSTPGNYDISTQLSSSNQPRNINISNMTLSYDSSQGKIFNTAVSLHSCKDSVFSNIKLQGAWDADGEQSASRAFDLISFSSAVQLTNNCFSGIDIQGFCYGINSSWDISDNHFTHINFETCLVGIRLGANMPVSTSEAEFQTLLSQGQALGPQNTTFDNCSFREVYHEGVAVVKGINNISKHNRFYDVGNDGGDSSTPTTAVIRFDVAGNSTLNDWFLRTQELSYGAEYVNVDPTTEGNYQADVSGPRYLPEVEGVFNYKALGLHSIDAIDTDNTWVTAFRLPGNQNRSFYIDYEYTSPQSGGLRQGSMTVVVDAANETVTLNDEYDFLGANSSVAENLQFRAKLINITSGEGNDTTLETVYIEMKNNTSNDTGSLNFTISSKS